jgi:hypothetical protein
MALGVCARDVAGVCGDQKLGCGVKWDALHCRIVGESEFGGLGTHVDCSMSPVDSHTATPLAGVVVTIHHQRCEAYAFLDGCFDIASSILTSHNDHRDYFLT